MYEIAGGKYLFAQTLARLKNFGNKMPLHQF